MFNPERVIKKTEIRVRIGELVKRMKDKTSSEIEAIVVSVI